MGSVRLPDSLSPSQSAKSCAWMVVKIRNTVSINAFNEVPSSVMSFAKINPQSAAGSDARCSTSNRKLTENKRRASFKCAIASDVTHVLQDRVMAES